MSKLPRDISGLGLAKCLEKLGYKVVRQSGSHLRLTATGADNQRHVTIPAKAPPKLGTLNAILREVANFFQIPEEELLRILFD